MIDFSVGFFIIDLRQGQTIEVIKGVESSSMVVLSLLVEDFSDA